MSERDKRREERFARVRAALDELDSGDLAELLCSVLDERRLDDEGNPTDVDGLYTAATAAVIGLLAPGELRAPDRELVERLAYVGRGGKVQTKDQDTARMVVQLSELLACGWPADKWPNLTSKAKADTIAKTLEGWGLGTVDVGRIERALEAGRSHARLVAEVAAASGIIAAYSEHDGHAWRAALKKIKQYLERYNSNRP